MAADSERTICGIQSSSRQGNSIWIEHARIKSGEHLDELTPHCEVAIYARTRAGEQGRSLAAGAEESQGLGMR